MARIVTELAAGAVVAGAAVRAVRAFPPVDLRDAVVVITGASRGLGYALARRFARERARLVLCARDAEHVEGAARELRRDGAEVLARRCNVADPAEVHELVAAATERFGPVDVLVNNAGVITIGPVVHQRLEDFQESMDVMFWGVVHPTMAVLPAMIERGRGHVATITSIGGMLSPPHLVPYASAKFAAVGFTEGIAAELAADGIAVTTVVPGLMRTGSHRNVVVKGRHEEEYRWFALAASNALTTTAPERAADRIVRAIRHRRRHVFVGFDARVAARLHGLAPATTITALGWAARALPRPGGRGAERSLGRWHETDLTLGAATAPGREEGRRLRQEPFGEPDRVGRHAATKVLPDSRSAG